MKHVFRKLAFVFLTMVLIFSSSLYPAVAHTTASAGNPYAETDPLTLWYYNYETGESYEEALETSQSLYAAAAQIVQTRPAYCPPNISNALESGVETRGVPTDQSTVRAHSYPYCAAGKLELYIDEDNDGDVDIDRDNPAAEGTAFLVAEDIILTAAHCIYQPSGTAKRAYFYPAQQNDSDSYCETYGTYIVASLMSTAYRDSQDLSQDWAICQIAHNRGDTFGWFGLSSSAGVYTGLSLTALGYPGNEVGRPAVVEECQYKSPGTVSSILSTMRFKTTNYVQGGYSGGPLYDSNGLVYGIISMAEDSLDYGTTNTIAIQFPTYLYNKIIEYCDASEARWS